MASINTPKSFDKQLIDGEALKTVEPFIDYVNQNFDQLIRAFFNQITVSENLRGKFVSLSAKHGVPLTLDVTQGISAVWPYRVSGGSLRSYNLTTDTKGRPNVTFYFDDYIDIKVRSLAFSSPHVTAETNAIVTPGDKVRITKVGNAANAGDFLVLGTEAPNKIVYLNTSGVAETASAYRGSEESAKTVDLFVFYP